MRVYMQDEKKDLILLLLITAGISVCGFFLSLWHNPYLFLT
jgi:hypothetical protein